MNNIENYEYPEQMEMSSRNKDLLIYPENRDYLDLDCLKATNFLAILHKIFGVLAMLQGILISLTLIGALIGVPLILAGKKLFDSGEDLSKFNISNSMNDIRSFFGNYKKYWKNVILIIIFQIAAVFLAIIFLIISIAMSNNKNTSSGVITSPEYTVSSANNSNSTETNQLGQVNPLSSRRNLDLDELHNLMEEVVINGNENELSKYTKEELKILRNMIFAEKGYIFSKGQLKEYFETKPWYKPYIKNQTDIQLNEYEKTFISIMSKYEGIPDPVVNYNKSIEAVNRTTFRTSRNIDEIDLDELHSLMEEVVINGNEGVLTEYSRRELKILRNMIFAEKGYIFKGGEMDAYFNRKSWYDPYIDDQSLIQLSEYEKEFVNKLRKYEGS